MSQEEVFSNGPNGPTIPLLSDQTPPPSEPISLPQVFSIGADAVSYLLTGQPVLSTFSVPRLVTARERLHHLHLATAIIQSDPQDMLRVLGILLRD